jgi:hypothetical protein
MRDAALKIADWFKIGESEPASSEQSDEATARPEVRRGIYAGPDGTLFEVIANALSGEDLERLVVYRKLSDDYGFWVAPPQKFGAEDSLYKLVKAL